MLKWLKSTRAIDVKFSKLSVEKITRAYLSANFNPQFSPRDFTYTIGLIQGVDYFESVWLRDEEWTQTNRLINNSRHLTASTWYIYDHKVSWLTYIHVGMQCERTCSSGNITQGREIIGNCLFNTFSVRILLKQLLFDLDFYVLIVDEAQHIIYCSLMRTLIIRTSYVHRIILNT